MCKKVMFSLFFFFCLFFTFSIFSSSTYAVSDISETYTGSVSQWQDIFPNCTGDCLNDYNYLIVEIENPDYTVQNGLFRTFVRFDGSNARYMPLSIASSYSIYTLPFNGSLYNYFSFGVAYNFSDYGSVTFTLTESYQSDSPSGSIFITENGEYDVTSYATAVVDVPEIEVPGDYHNDLVNIYHSIILCGGVILVLYFFYCIYRTIIKATGGKQ